IASGERLYGLEYIPAQLSTFTVFTEGVSDLVWNGSSRPKNSARGVIRLLAGQVPDGRLEIQTRMGNDYTTGTSTNQPSNLSNTYVWVNATVPFTERYQFMGDPRHIPYSDIKNSRRYNWYVPSVNAADDTNFSAA